MSLEQLANYRNDLHKELESILGYWAENCIDNKNGGFVGKIDNGNVVDFNAAKGSVLNARILWSFSAAYNLLGDQKHLDLAERAYQYIIKNFVDETYGGVYWSVDATGKPLDSKKQVYAIAFTIYALSEYFIASQQNNAKSRAIELYELLVSKAYDQQLTGYFEAFKRDWSELSDLRLSEKDANEKKTMNTHLHILEAYTTLFKIWPEPRLKAQIETLIDNFSDCIVDANTAHLILFFDESWRPKSKTISYGHDIEASWLLLEAAEAINDKTRISRTLKLAPKLATAVNTGLDTDGALLYEYEPAHSKIIKEKHWWVQAEAMVGFFNAWQISGDTSFLHQSLASWQFVKKNLLDRKHGEWFWGIDAEGAIMEKEDKVGMWKCPYHNTRACIELIRRISAAAV